MIDREYFYGEWNVAFASRPNKIRFVLYFLPNMKWEMQQRVTAGWRKAERFMQIVDAAYGGEWDIEYDNYGETFLVMAHDLEHESAVDKISSIFMGKVAKVAFEGIKAMNRDAGRGQEMKSKSKIQKVSDECFTSGQDQAIIYRRRPPRQY